MSILFHGRIYPSVKCGYCGKQMEIDDVDGYGYNAEIYYICDCGSWCRVKNKKVIDYGREEPISQTSTIVSVTDDDLPF